MVPAYFDYLVRGSAILLVQGFPLDADMLVSDYLAQDARPWDILFEGNSSNTASRSLTVQNGAKLAIIGSRAPEAFDAVSLSNLQALSYNLESIDMSDGSANLQADFSFAVKTNQGRYAKIRISRVVTEGTSRNLGLEAYVYR